MLVTRRPVNGSCIDAISLSRRLCVRDAALLLHRLLMLSPVLRGAAGPRQTYMYFLAFEREREREREKKKISVTDIDHVILDIWSLQVMFKRVVLHFVQR